MTEDEAKTKVCCGSVATAWATIATAYAAAGNAELVPEAPKCVGSPCMAWRWTVHPRHASPPSPASGYCGLAGAPA